VSKRTRIALGLTFLLLVVGLAVDLSDGLPMLRSSRSWAAWLVAIVVVGALELLGEGAAEWVNKRDRVTHPLWKRSARLVLLLSVGSLFAVAMWGVMRMTR
jgi:hypothetical protein